TSTRPRTHRKRSNSFPIVDALGCSTAEAKIILAEGTAAVRSRQPSVRRGGRRHRSVSDKETTFRPQDHMKYLYEDPVIVEDPSDDLVSSDVRSSSHTRIPSDHTDRSNSTVTGLVQPPAHEPRSATASPSSPLGNYSANLTKFIQSQLNSIPSYRSSNPPYPRSCPDLSFRSRTPPQSPTKSRQIPVEMPHIEMPQIRPPLRSAFSAWSSTDDETEDDVPPLRAVDRPRKDSKASTYTPSILRCYENSSSGSFLLSGTPSEEEEQQHPFADGFSFPRPPVASVSDPDLQFRVNEEDEYLSSASARPKLTSSSAPSFSSVSTTSYFDYKRPLSIAPHVRDRILAAVSPHQHSRKIIPAISPFEGGALANVHDILVESQNRVMVEGLSFDLLRDLKMPDEGAPRVPTPC
ncbi:hypothetical protein K469DRAFT_507602, partial [Zopfia rhizophila CBS 207.26]